MIPVGSGPGLRLGVRLPQYASSWPDLRDAAIRAESLGFDSVWLNDHLWTPGRLHRDAAFDAFTGLAAIAAVTNRITLGTAVLSAAYRPPALGAKMASVLQHISAGRLVIGIGTGSDKGEHDAYGYPFVPPKERTAGLLQALDVMRAMFANPEGATVDGLITDAPCAPGPTTAPILIAAHRPRLLRIAGERADGIFAAFLEPDDLAERVAIAVAAREAAGIETPLRVATYLYALPVRDRDEALEWITPEATALESEPGTYLRWLEGKGLVGSPAEIASRLRAFADAGATDAILVMPNRVPPETLDALAEVMETSASVNRFPASASREANLVDLLVERHRRDGRGHTPAVTDEDGTWTYDDLSAAVGAGAGALRGAGLRVGERVAVVLRDGRHWIQAVLGTAAAAGVAIPLDPNGDHEMLAGILDDAAPTIVVTEVPVPEGPWRTMTPDDLAQGTQVPVTAVHPEDPAYIVFSSGSTGRPKGAVHAHRDMRTSVDGYATEVLGLGPGDTCHAVSRGFTSLGFGNGFFRPLGCGAHVIHTRITPNVRTVIHACRDHGVTVLTGVPTFWSQLAEFVNRHPDQLEGLSTVRLGASSGDSLPATVLRRLREVMPSLDVVEGLGCSECSNVVLSTRPGDDLPGSLGRPVPGAEVSLRDADGVPVPSGTAGQLWIKSESNTSGYFRRVDLTRDLLMGEWIRMGDMVIEEQGIYRHVGRVDDLFKVDAKWVSPIAVENVVLSHAAVAEVVVVGRHDDRGLMRPIAVAVAVDGADTDAAAKEIHAAVAHELGIHAAPVMEWRDELPHLASGKVNRRVLRESATLEPPS